MIARVARGPGTQTKRLLPLCLLLLGVTLTGEAGTSASAEDRGQDTAAATECCFENPKYAGGCVVSPSGRETCTSILDYLDNPASSGKSYCGFTEIRGGWREARCPAERRGEPRAHDRRSRWEQATDQAPRTSCSRPARAQRGQLDSSS